jgi:hypothetical protein
MSGRLWLEAVERELFRRRLPRQEVARLVAELSDHLADAMDSRSAAGPSPAQDAANMDSLLNFTEEHMSKVVSAAECLGSPAEIAETAVQEFRRRRTLLSRSWLAAFCTFVLLPLPALLVGWLAAFQAVRLLCYSCEWFRSGDGPVREITPSWVLGVNVLLVILVVAPATTLAALFGRLAQKTAHRWWWGLAACFLVALATPVATTTATFSESPGKDQIRFYVPLYGSAQHWRSLYWKSLAQPTQLGQFLLPLGVGVLILRRCREAERFIRPRTPS